MNGTSLADLGHFDLVRSRSTVGAGAITGTPLTADPQLGPLQSNGGLTQTLAPQTGSPAIDAGSAFGLTTDQRGQRRPSNFISIPDRADGSDIGAVELAAPAPAAAAAAFGSKTLVTLKLLKSRITTRSPVQVRITNKNGFVVTGRISAATIAKVKVSKRKVVKTKTAKFTIKASGRKTVKLRLPKALRKLLRRKHRLSLRLTAKVKDPAGHTRTVKKKIKPKLKLKRRRKTS